MPGKKYYTLNEAAELLTSRLMESISKRDVLEHAMDGSIRLCMFFDGTLYKFNRDIKGSGKLKSIDDYKFRGYIQIPQKRISPMGGEIQFSGVTLIEVIDVWACVRDPLLLEDKALSAGIFDTSANKFLSINIFTNCDEALIPRQDLFDYINKSQVAEIDFTHSLDENKLAVPVPQIESIKGIGKQIVILKFKDICWGAAKWSRNLADPPNWLKVCRVSKGTKGKNNTSLWNPVRIALALLDRGITIEKLNAVFVNFKDWRDEWEEASEYLN